MQQPLREIHLEHVAGVDVVDRPLDRRMIAVGGKIAGQAVVARDRELRGEGGCSKRFDIVRFGSRWMTAVTAARETGPVEQRRVRAARPDPFREALRNQPGVSLLVIERDHDVVQADGQRGKLEIRRLPRRGIDSRLRASS